MAHHNRSLCILLSCKIPCPINCFPLEVITKAEVPKHLKKGLMSSCSTHIIHIICSNTPLSSCCTSHFSRCLQDASLLQWLMLLNKNLIKQSNLQSLQVDFFFFKFLNGAHKLMTVIMFTIRSMKIWKVKNILHFIHGLPRKVALIKGQKVKANG